MSKQSLVCCRKEVSTKFNPTADARAPLAAPQLKCLVLSHHEGYWVNHSGLLNLTACKKLQGEVGQRREGACKHRIVTGFDA
jgi:hypothetical protein